MNRTNSRRPPPPMRCQPAGAKPSAGEVKPSAAVIGNGRVSFGTDLNGLVKGQMPVLTSIDPAKLPQQLKSCPDIYDPGFVMSKTGDRTWNYCTDGVAHYGMLSDFLKHIYTLPKGDFVETHVMENAEMFAAMWEKAAMNSKNVK